MAQTGYSNTWISSNDNSLRYRVNIDNYIYLYHTDTFLLLPMYPEQISDSTSIGMSSKPVLGRSAPIYSYSGSGPRTMQFSFELHREEMKHLNLNRSNAKLAPGDDYVDAMIKQILAAALPNYNSSEKLVDPPMAAVRLGTDIFIKGVVTGTVGVEYEKPILIGDKYAKVVISFGVSEITPYGATDIFNIGSYRDSGDVPIDLSADALSGTTYVVPRTSMTYVSY